MSILKRWNGTSWEIITQITSPRVTNIEEIIAPIYEQKAYNKGDYVIYGDKLYICNSNISATETWSSALTDKKWEEISILELINRKSIVKDELGSSYINEAEKQKYFNELKDLPEYTYHFLDSEVTESNSYFSSGNNPTSSTAKTYNFPLIDYDDSMVLHVLPNNWLSNAQNDNNGARVIQFVLGYEIDNSFVPKFCNQILGSEVASGININLRGYRYKYDDDEKEKKVLIQVFGRASSKEDLNKFYITRSNPFMELDTIWTPSYTYDSTGRFVSEYNSTTLKPPSGYKRARIANYWSLKCKIHTASSVDNPQYLFEVVDPGGTHQTYTAMNYDQASYKNVYKYPYSVQIYSKTIPMSPGAIDVNTNPIITSDIINDSTRVYAYINCTAGDKFIINSTNDVSSYRSWTFLNNSHQTGTPLSEWQCSELVTNCNDTIITAPANAKYLIVNALKTDKISYYNNFKNKFIFSTEYDVMKQPSAESSRIDKGTLIIHYKNLDKAYYKYICTDGTKRTKYECDKWLYAGGLPIDAIFYDKNGLEIPWWEDGEGNLQTSKNECLEYNTSLIYPTSIKIPENTDTYYFSIYGPCRINSYAPEILKLEGYLGEFFFKIKLLGKADHLPITTNNKGNILSNSKKLLNLTYPSEYIIMRYLTINYISDSVNSPRPYRTVNGVVYAPNSFNKQVGTDVSWYSYLAFYRYMYGYNNVNNWLISSNARVGLMCASFVSAACNLPHYQGVPGLVRQYADKIKLLEEDTELQPGDLLLFLKFLKKDNEYPELYSHGSIISDGCYDRKLNKFYYYKRDECSNCWTRTANFSFKSLNSQTSTFGLSNKHTYNDEKDNLEQYTWKLSLPEEVTDITNSYRYSIDKEKDPINNPNITFPAVFASFGDRCIVGQYPPMQEQTGNLSGYLGTYGANQFYVFKNYNDQNITKIQITQMDGEPIATASNGHLIYSSNTDPNGSVVKVSTIPIDTNASSSTYNASNNGNKFYKLDLTEYLAKGAKARPDEYSTGRSYAVNDYIYREGEVYKCTTAVESGSAWSSGNWTEYTNSWGNSGPGQSYANPVPGIYKMQAYTGDSAVDLPEAKFLIPKYPTGLSTNAAVGHTAWNDDFWTKVDLENESINTYLNKSFNFILGQQATITDYNDSENATYYSQLTNALSQTIRSYRIKCEQHDIFKIDARNLKIFVNNNGVTKEYPIASWAFLDKNDKVISYGSNFEFPEDYITQSYNGVYYKYNYYEDYFVRAPKNATSLIINSMDQQWSAAFPNYATVCRGNRIKWITFNELHRLGDYNIYSSSKSYSVGDLVGYNGELYQCYSSVGTGSQWNPNKWTLLDDSQNKVVCDDHTNTIIEDNSYEISHNKLNFDEIWVRVTTKPPIVDVGNGQKAKLPWGGYEFVPAEKLFKEASGSLPRRLSIEDFEDDFLSIDQINLINTDFGAVTYRFSIPYHLPYKLPNIPQLQEYEIGVYNLEENEDESTDGTDNGAISTTDDNNDPE